MKHFFILSYRIIIIIIVVAVVITSEMLFIIHFYGQFMKQQFALYVLLCVYCNTIFQNLMFRRV